MLSKKIPGKKIVANFGSCSNKVLCNSNYGIHNICHFDGRSPDGNTSLVPMLFNRLSLKPHVSRHFVHVILKLIPGTYFSICSCVSQDSWKIIKNFILVFFIIFISFTPGFMENDQAQRSTL